MLPVGDFSIPKCEHADSLLLFAALAELIETGLQVRALLSLTLQLPFKLVDQCMRLVPRLRVTALGLSLASARTIRPGHGWCLLLGPSLAIESSNTLSLVTPARRNCLGHLFSS